MISIIVPVYNVENYARKCIESLISQTYKDIEIILVDDGSTDSSGAICDEYAQKDNRIKVIHKENGGLSDARNAGLDIASGDYIGFVDSDDYIDEHMYGHLYDILVDNNADMSVCDFLEVSDTDDAKDAQSESKIEIIEDKDVYKLVTSFNTADITAWNKLYKRDIFSDYRFEKGRLHEDQWAIPYVVSKCNRIVKSSAKLYYYVTRNDSISKTRLSPKRMWDLLDALSNSCGFFKDKRLYDEQNIEAHNLCNQIMDFYENACDFFDEPIGIKKELHDYFKKSMQLNSNVFSFKQVVYNSFMLFPQIGIVIKKIRERM
ncbi:glycosyltransferase family 2 protein [Butyrivibrio sp. AE2015]|uniref:glycosyltransferase family 2 protein n=1 Tax=Butyrivibrio sp. AE2015 TaxID=1280663 RepID=UPI0003B44710|nr:glycosyltransferase [Butyrivibrio sp. AE2015]